MDNIGKKLLLVEDDPYMQRMYERAFTAAGFSVNIANDGTIVFETVKLDRPDIIIMDVMMPNFNGLVALEELKASPFSQQIPVIMLSAASDDATIQKALKLGAIKYLIKSQVEPNEIIQIINDIIGKK